MLAASKISKRFGATVALDHVDFEAHAGEIHALVGENGAGKTTLMNIVAGRLRQDDGTASLDGVALPCGSALAALQAGIAAVNQSPMLFERMTWEENLAFGGFKTARFDLVEVAAQARRLAERLGFNLPPAGSTIEERTVAERVRLEVLRALSFEPQVLILDEPTGVLAAHELSSFLDLLRRLRGEGRIIILITHKLSEAMAVADRITILRAGRVVASTTPAETTEAELAKMMIGELPPPSEVAHARNKGAEVITLDDVSLRRDGHQILQRISLTVRSGEIVGIAGVDGNGQSELVEILAGVVRADTGEMRIVESSTIPENRDLVGLILDMPLYENLLLSNPLRQQMTRNGWLDTAGAVTMCDGLLKRFRIRASGPEAPAAELSGGNRQRLEVARAIAASPKAIVAHNICRGLDLAGTAEVHRTLASFAANGGAVLLISSDLDELLESCERLFVISHGRLRETIPAERNPETLGLLMSGNWQ